MLDENLTQIPSSDKFRAMLDYDPATGVFLWRWRDDVPRNWNTRYAGTVAGTVNSRGYRQINIDGRPHKAHRVAWLIVTGEWPTDQLDHVNGTRSDNSMINLREVNNTENMRNAAMRSDNASGVMGVSWDKVNGKWRSTIKANGRYIHLGRFADIADAIAARAAAEIGYGFHANHGRSPEGWARSRRRNIIMEDDE